MKGGANRRSDSLRTLFLHVGMHKTGTSSIQQTLHAQREILPAFGFAYFPPERNHSRAIASIVGDNPHRHAGNRLAGRHDREAAALYAAESREALQRFLAEEAAPNLIVSGEGIGMLGDPDIDRLLALLRPLVDRLVVVGLVRNPRPFLISATQQAVKAGRTLEELAGPAMRSPAYRKRFERFDRRPEVDEVRLRRYHPGHLVRGCSVATFLDMCGAPPALYDRLQVARENVTVSGTAVRALLVANEVVPVFLPDGSLNPGRARGLRRLLEGLPGERFTVPAALIDRAMAAAAADIAWMEQRLGARLDDDEPPGEAGAEALRQFTAADVAALVRLLNDRLVAQEKAARKAGPQHGGGRLEP
jgi:hypothetical protein